MLPEVLRSAIDNYGRWTLIKASELNEEGVRLTAITGDLGIAEEDISFVIECGNVLRRIAAEQKSWENSITETY